MNITKQNRNRLTDTENKLVVTGWEKGDGRGKEGNEVVQTTVAIV